MWRLLLVVSLLSCSCEASVSCRDENGNPVDWYILYKTPKNDIRGMDGLDYMYIYPSGPQNTATSQRNNKKINAPNGILANTLAPILTNNVNSNIRSISYSDQPPQGCGSGCDSNGHSKGVVIVDASPVVAGGPAVTGIWLLHSTPRFPSTPPAPKTPVGQKTMPAPNTPVAPNPVPPNPNSFYPDTGIANAQTFICVTFNVDQFQHIGEHLQYINAFKFDSNPSTFSLVDLSGGRKVQHNTPKKQPINHAFQLLTSSGGKQFHSIIKQRSERADGGDLYVKIAELIVSPVVVQSWGNQPDRDGSFCVANKHNVLNVLSVNTVLGQWESCNDHSKWCIATDNNKPVTCIADVNRSKSQYERLGGALCVRDEEIRNIFRGLVKYANQC